VEEEEEEKEEKVFELHDTLNSRICVHLKSTSWTVLKIVDFAFTLHK
jgi:hypothetical protein